MKIPPGRHSNASGNPEHGGRLARIWRGKTGFGVVSSLISMREPGALGVLGTRTARPHPPGAGALVPGPAAPSIQTAVCQDSCPGSWRPARLVNCDLSTLRSFDRLRTTQAQGPPAQGPSPRPKFASSRRATRAGHPAFRTVPGSGAPSHPSVSIRPLCPRRRAAPPPLPEPTAP